MNLPEMSVRRPVTALMMFLGVILVGVFCFVQMPIDLLPEMDIPTITVMTPYSGAGPEEVEEKITRPLEQQLATVQDLKHLISTSSEGMSTITLQFEWEVNIDERANDIRDAIDMAVAQLPDEADRSRIFKMDMSQIPVLIYGVYAGPSYENLQDILDNDVAKPLESVPGVGSVQVFTPLKRQVNVDLNRERLASYGLTPDDVVGAIARENREASAGSIKMGDMDYLPRVPGEFREVEPMNDIVVRASKGDIVRIRDLGAVTEGFKDRELNIRINGQPGAIFFVLKQSQANTVDVADQVMETLPKLAKRLPSDIQFITVVDSSDSIRRMARDLMTSLLGGGALAMLAVLIFLRQVRGTLIIGLTIPFSLIAAGIIMYALDYTINMMTLFALIVAIGMVVDNAIVVLENITRHREEGEGAFEGAVFGATEVGMAITASTLTTLCVFFPLFFVKGVARIIFVPFAVVATVVLMASLFTALSMTPMLASKLLGKKYEQRDQGAFFSATERAFDWLANEYSTMLGWCLRHRAVVLGAVAFVCIASLALVPFIGWEFMPKEDSALVMGTAELPVGTRVERTAEALDAITKVIAQEIPSEQIIGTFARCGTSDRGMTDQGSNVGAFGIRLVPKEKRDRDTSQIAAALRKRIAEMAPLYSIVKYRVSTSDPMAGMIMGGEQPLSVNILADDLETARRFADELKVEIAKIPNTVDIESSMEKGSPEVWVEVNRTKASSMGLNVSTVADTVRTSIYGRVAGKYRVRGDEYDIFVRLREEDRIQLADLGELPVRLPSGELVRIENIADVRSESGPVQIERKDQRRIIHVQGDVQGRSLGEVMADVKQLLAQTNVPQGLEVQMGGQSEDIREAFLWLTLALFIGMTLVYMIMASQFESLVDPFVVMFSVPVAFVGVLWALAIGGYHLNIVVFLGALLLIGVVVNNAIVLVDYTNILRARGRSMIEAIQEAGRTRLRPVLMTAVTTIFGVLPMAFHSGQGSETWNPLGVTILSGLLVSTLVTLILVPTIYSVFESRIKSRLQS